MQIHQFHGSRRSAQQLDHLRDAIDRVNAGQQQGITPGNAGDVKPQITPKEKYWSLIDEAIKSGMSRSDAIRSVANHYPSLRQQIMADANQ